MSYPRVVRVRASTLAPPPPLFPDPTRDRPCTTASPGLRYQLTVEIEHSPTEHTIEDYPVPSLHQPSLLHTGAGNLLVVPCAPTAWAVAFPFGAATRPRYPGVVALQDYAVASGVASLRRH